MATDDRDTLIEAATTAWRPRAPHGPLRFHPAWWDLDPPGRQAAHDRARVSRAIEAALDPEGLSTTAKAVMARIRAEPRR